MLAAMGNGEKSKPVLIFKGVRHPQKVTKATIRYQISKPLQHGLPSASKMCYEVSYDYSTAIITSIACVVIITIAQLDR